MSIQLIKDDERQTYNAEGTKIFYRRISELRKNSIIKRHTKRGKTDYGAVALDELRYIVTGWEGMQEGGKDVPFDADLVERIPGDYLNDILELSGGNIEGSGDGSKNSKTSSPGA